MRELRVEDALLYLDQVKIEFGDRPHVYNEFLDIMKHFKAQMIDTPGVIQRVSNLFSGNKRLVLGFNTFLPEGYKIELDAEGNTIASQVGVPGTVTLATASGAPVPQPQSQMQQPLSMSPPQGIQQHQSQQEQHRQQQKAQGIHSVGQQGNMKMLGVTKHPVNPSGNAAASPMIGAPAPSTAAAASEVGQQSQMHRREGGQGGPTGFRQIRTNVRPGNGGATAVDKISLPQPPKIRKIVQPLAQNKIRGASSPMASTSQQQPPQQQGAQPVEFDHAINYVTTIKKRFSTQPQIYKSFLEILHTYQKEQRGIEQVLEDVSDLFGDHPDLLREFCYFLPDGVQQQARRQLEEVVKMRQNAAAATKKQSRSSAKTRAQAPVPVPFGATKGRSEQRQREIQKLAKFGTVSFSPKRPPRRNEVKAKEVSNTGQPTCFSDKKVVLTILESAWLEKAKKHLTSKELISPSGALSSSEKKNTPWTEFCKSLHLFASGLLNKEELILLLQGLFFQGHAPKSGVNAGGSAAYPYIADQARTLLREFESVLVGRGRHADQLRAEVNKSKYGYANLGDIDYESDKCKNPTPSYFVLPSDYPESSFFKHSGQSAEDRAVLNSELVCPVKRSMEDDYVLSHHVYAKEMFKLEDERYEVDMAIERNASAIKNLEAVDKEIRDLKEIEETEGQPFGRLTYKLKYDSINQNTVHAIGRLYNLESSDIFQNKILHYLDINPFTAIPIIFQRLKQKDSEWRRVKGALVSRWQGVNSLYYDGVSDISCTPWRKRILDYVTDSALIKECQVVDVGGSKHTSISPFSAESVSEENYFLKLFDPCLKLLLPISDTVHKDVFSLLMAKRACGDSTLWTEFMAPFFGMDYTWYDDRFRETYDVGEVAETPYGSGPILEIFTSCDETLKSRYVLELPYGKAFVNASSISKCNMRKNCSTSTDSPSLSRQHHVGRECFPHYSIIFGPKSLYLFMRRYTIMLKILTLVRKKMDVGSSDRIDSIHVNGKLRTKRARSYPEFLKYIKSLLNESPRRRSGTPLTKIENTCRFFAKDLTYMTSCLGELVENLATSLSEVNTVEVIELFQFTSSRIVHSLNFNDVRNDCLEVTNQAVYRIQLQKVDPATIFFSHVPNNEDILTAPSNFIKLTSSARKRPESDLDNIDPQDMKKDSRSSSPEAEEAYENTYSKRQKLTPV